MSGGIVMTDPNAAAGPLKQELAMVSDAIRAILSTDNLSGPLRDILETVRDGEGKMIRPSVLLLAGRFGPGFEERRQLLCRVAAAVEIVHIASLIHDDIVDDAPLRRGSPSVQARFGKEMAVYAGDFLLCRVMLHMSRENLDPCVPALVAQTIEEMCAGEIGQYHCRWNTETTMDQYLKNIRGKTVAMFIASFRLGATVAGADPETVELLGKVGEALGVMFQLRDDLLDYTSTVLHEKKPVDLDFLSGVFTMPVLYAFRHKQYGNRLRELASVAARGGAGPDLMREVRELVDAGGGIRFTHRQMVRNAFRAERLLLSLPQSEAALAIQDIIRRLKAHPTVAAALFQTA